MHHHRFSDIYSGYLVERIAHSEKQRCATPQFSYYATRSGSYLIIILGRPSAERIGFIFLPTEWDNVRAAAALKAALRKGLIQRGYVLVSGGRSYFRTKNVLVLPALRFLEDIDFWIGERPSLVLTHKMLDRYIEIERQKHRNLILPPDPKAR